MTEASLINWKKASGKANVPWALQESSPGSGQGDLTLRSGPPTYIGAVLAEGADGRFADLAHVHAWTPLSNFYPTYYGSSPRIYFASGDYLTYSVVGNEWRFYVASTQVALLGAAGFEINSGAELRLWDVGNSHYVGFEAPALTASKIWVLPAADGAANKVLGTDGAGNLIWRDHGEIAGLGDADHAAYVLKSLFEATTFLYATNDDTPQPKTPEEVMAILSGAAGANFAMNAKKITGLAAASANGDAVRYEQLHAKYTGGEAIAAVEGEPTLALDGAITEIHGDANFTMSIVSGKPRITFADGDYLEYDRGNDSFDFFVASTEKIAIDGWGLKVPGGIMSIGKNDDVEGILYLYGDAAESVAGGRIHLYMAADHDGTVDAVVIRVNEDDLEIRSFGGNCIVVKGDTGNVEIANALDVAGNITVGGTVDGVDIAARDHAEAHGPSVHTGFDTWKLIYTDAAGDQQEVAVGADATVFAGKGAAAAPGFEEVYASHVATFSAAAEDLTVETLQPMRVCVGESGEHGTFTAIPRAKATAGTAGAGTNTILIEADDNPAFSSPTVLMTLALDAATEVDDTSLDNPWAAGDIHIRARCTAVDATAPKDVVVFYFYKERVEAF